MIPAETRFHTVLCQLADKLNNIVKDMGEDGRQPISPILSNVAVEFVKSYTDHKSVINKFIIKSYDHWDRIRNRDLTFFRNSASVVFGDIPMSGINDIFNSALDTKKEDGTNYVTQDTIDDIWRRFDFLLNISISYLHDNSGPSSEIKDGKQIHVYTVSLYGKIPHFPKIDILKEAVKNDEAAKRNGVFKFSLRDKLIFPLK